MLLGELLLALVYCDGDMAAKSSAIDKVRSKGYNDLELFSVLLAVLRHTGRRMMLASYIEEFLASLITQLENVKCWDESDKKAST